MTDIYSQQARNRRITILLFAGFFVFAALVGLSVDIYATGSIDAVRAPVATGFAVAFALINCLFSYYYGAGLIIRSVGAVEPVFENPTHKKLHNIVTEMALASGLPMPKVFVIPDPAPNAFATGRNPENSTVVVTQGLLDTMSRDELQAVVAHELGHIRNRDILTMMVAAVLLGTVSLLTDWAIRTWRFGGVRARRAGKGKGLHPVALLVIALFVLLSPLISRVLAMSVSRAREYQADTSAAEFTRNPAALASALEKIRDSSSPVKSAHRGTAHLFISDPLKRKLDEREGFFANLFSTHPPIEKRIERLKKMAYAREKFGDG